MKILLVDDHALLRDSLSMLLHDRYGPALQLLEAKDGRVAMNQIMACTDIDLILLDIDLPDVHGFQVLKWLAGRTRAAPVLALSGNCEPQFIQQCLSLGADGFLPKTSSGDAMLGAIEDVLNGRGYQPKESLSMPGCNDHNTPLLLTERQLDVLRLLRKGLSNEEIAATLDICLPTVKTHVSTILEKLGVKNRTEAVNEALLLHLI